MLLNIVRRPGGLLAAVVALGVPLALASAPASADDDHPVVVATTSIWASVVDQLDCTDAFDVQTLVPVGGDPHEYEPSMRDRATLDDAALVVSNGAGLESLLTDTLDAVADDGTPVYAVADHVTLSPMGAADSTPSGDAGDDESGDDPHIWFDPTLVASALPSLADALVAAGADRSAIDACAEALTQDLTDLDAQVAAILDVVPESRRLLVTNHDALGYFARHYGWRILGSVLPSSSTLAEASPAQLQRLADDIEAAGVPAIFTEQLETTDEATALADRLGVRVVTLYTDSLGDADSGVTTYQDLLRVDARSIADALAP
jgi:zinc/manganese transport system substrate-binding protein